MNNIDQQIDSQFITQTPVKPTMRYERKLRIPMFHFSALKHHLHQRMTPDPNNKEQGYLVESLYLDTHDLKMYYEKADGKYRRVKTRLRFYESSWEKTFPELKIKIGDLGYKRRTTCSFNKNLIRPGRLVAHIYSRAADFGPFAQNVMEMGLAPVCWVNYRRYAFSHSVGLLRVTMDFDIRTAHPWQRKSTIRCFSPNHFILEIKHADRFPNWIRLLVNNLQQQPMAISKYGMGLNALLGAHGYV